MTALILRAMPLVEIRRPKAPNHLPGVSTRFRRGHNAQCSAELATRSPAARSIAIAS
jgi:hypothetical protein